jgi:DNA-directed RNA polymerase
MQDTQWRVNNDVLAVMRRVWELNLPLGMPQSQPYEIPPCPLDADTKAADLDDNDPEKLTFNEWKATARNLHNLETDRVAKLRALMRTVRIAGEMSEKDMFYYVYQCDFRGRVYSATTGLSPQGTDHSKALLTFGRTEPLGVRGLHWLKIHGANKFGYDKTSYQDRVDWIDGQHDKWLAVAADPIGMRSEWAGCDKPWQFLAWAFEYKRATDNGPGYRSSLPIALDGSCNGLQHFSAMLRDPIGGRAVNLVPSDVPEDIYQRVADVCTRKLRGLSTLPDHGAAANWLSLFRELGLDGMPRALSKKPVMTLPYGSTTTACTQSIFHWIHENAVDFFPKNTNFRHSIYLSPILWDSISEVVIAARAAMRWIQESSSVLSKRGHCLEYPSPLGFPIKQANPKLKIHKINTIIGGRIVVNRGVELDKLDVRKMRQGSSPNLIHSVDASHMMMCVNAGLDAGIHSYSMIHDDFGVHANRVDDWQQIIRSSFVHLHTKHDILAEFKALHETRHAITLPDLPAKGTLDLDAVRDSPYFFG